MSMYQGDSYIVTWTIELDSESTVDARDAAGQAWAILGDAANGYGPATVLVVRDPDDAHLGTFDMADGHEIDRTGPWALDVARDSKVGT